MKKALLCVGNELRGDDGVAIAVGRLVEQHLPEWKVFFGYDTPENEFAALRAYEPDVIVVVDAMSGFKEDPRSRTCCAIDWGSLRQSE